MENKKGWRITLYSDENQTIINDRNELGINHLSWSPYDRMKISIEDNFQYFIFPKPDPLMEWCGVKKQLHLIPMLLLSMHEDECYDVRGYSDEWIQPKTDAKYLLVKNDSSVEYGLYCLVTFSLSDVIARYISQTSKSSEIKNRIVKDVMLHIKNVMESEKEIMQFDCIALESLGAEDFALMILSNDIKVFLKLLSIIRNQHVEIEADNSSDNKLFKSISAMTGFNNSNFEKPTSAKAFVNLCLQTDYNSFWKEFETKADEKKVKILEHFLPFQGSTTVGVIIQPNDFSFWLPKEGVLNGTSEFYKENIISSRTYWIEENDFDVADGNDVITVDGLIPKTYSTIKESLNNFRKSDEVFKTSNPVGYFIYSEYRRLLSLATCTGWIETLKYQQDVFRNCTEYYEKNGLVTQENHLLEEMQTVLTHINQACSSISEVPYHNHYYSGSFSDILKMYYGFIDAIITVGRNVPRAEKNKPSPLAFGIKFESANKIHTTLYSTPDHKYRIAIFHLPYESLHSFKNNMELLVHEVFHYIAPIDRGYRNRSILNVWIECIIELYTEHLCENGNAADIANEIRDYLNKIWTKLCEESYEKAQISINNFHNIENNDFTEPLVAQEALLFITQVINKNVESYLKQCISASSKKEERKKYTLFLEKIDNYTTDYLIWRFTAKNAVLRMVEYVVALKEAFCDLFMCSVFNLNFEKYLSFFGLSEYLENFKSAELTVVYRINVVKYILETSYQETTYSNSKFLSWDSYEALDDSFTTEEAQKKFNQFKGDSANTLKNPQLYDVLLKVLFNEIEFLKEIHNFDVYKTIEILRDIHNTETVDQDDTQRDINQKVSMIRKCMDSFFVSKNEDTEIGELFITSKKVNYSVSYDHSIWVYSLTDYIYKMCSIANESEEDQLWYRGVCNETYSLLPSLFRFLDDSLSLYANQVNILKRAYSSTLQYPELWRGNISEQMCCLQHYGMPTNLLDFSLDMLVALHFAINPDVESDRIDLEKGLITPAVYVFRPQKYASAVRALQKGSPLEDVVDKYKVSPVLYDIAGDDMTGYFPNKMEFSELIKHTKTFNEDYIPSPRIDNYPIPVIIRRSNSRILVQNGTFLAYNLDAKPFESDKNKYSYLDLWQIERNYEQLLLDNGIHGQKFIEKVKINPCSISAIRKDLITLGISTSKMYPELQHIFSEEKDKYRKQISKSNKK